MSIRYYSTLADTATARRSTVSLRDALFLGQPADGGLFLPERLPHFTPEQLRAMSAKSYPEIAFDVLWPFVEGTLGEAAFRAILADAYNFEVPLEAAGDNLWLMRLDRGPTASFKDFAARLMARLMTALMGTDQTAPIDQTDKHLHRPAATPPNRHAGLTVLVATSGDTGGAVGHAFRGLPGVAVYILYPGDEVSPAQRRQLDGLGQNVQAVRVSGTFDDCQRLVKDTFLDPAFAGLGLTSANSINIGRILPQTVYYFHAWSRLAKDGEAITFSVPSGNFGNSFGCELARRMGLPVERLILAVNANDEFPRFQQSGNYVPLSPSRACLSNAMNVGNPSNLARYFSLFGGTLRRDGTTAVQPDLAAMREELRSISISDADTVACMQRWWNERHVLLEPHGAVGVAALERLGCGGHGPAVCLETAHPAKFREIVQDALGFAPANPAALAELEASPQRFDPLPPDYAAWKKYLLARPVPG